MSRTPNSERFGNEAGVTVAEIVVGLMISSVMILAAAPVFSELIASYQLRGATHEIFAELQRSRLAAVMKNNPYRFSVIPGSGSYKIHDDADHDYVEDAGEVTFGNVGVNNAGIELTGGSVVTFLANGTALTPGTFTIANGQGASRSVNVGAGGSIRIQ